MGTDARGENVEISRNKEKSEQKKKSSIDNLNQKVCGTLSELQQVQVVLLFVVFPEFFFFDLKHITCKGRHFYQPTLVRANGNSCDNLCILFAKKSFLKLFAL